MKTRSDLFKDLFSVRKVGPNLWRAFSKDMTPMSPIYTDPEAAIYYVERELKQEMEENIETLLGGSNDASSVHDVSTLCSGLSVSEPRDGSEKI